MESHESLTTPNTESMSDLPSIMREKLELGDEMDFLEASTPPGTVNNFNVDFSYHAERQSPTIIPIDLLKPIAYSLAEAEPSVPRPPKYHNLENIVEEESCELDNSRLTEKRCTYNEFEKVLADPQLQLRRSIMDGTYLLEGMNMVKSAGYFENQDDKLTVQDRGPASQVFKESTSKHHNTAQKIPNAGEITTKEVIFQNFMKVGKNKAKHTRVVSSKSRRSETAKVLISGMAGSAQKPDFKKASFKSDNGSVPTPLSANGQISPSAPYLHRSGGPTPKTETGRQISPPKISNIKIYHSNNIIINLDGKCRLSQELVAELLAKNMAISSASRIPTVQGQSLVDNCSGSIPKNAFAKNKRGSKFEPSKPKSTSKRPDEKLNIQNSDHKPIKRNQTGEIRQKTKVTETESVQDSDKKPSTPFQFEKDPFSPNREHKTQPVNASTRSKINLTEHKNLIDRPINIFDVKTIHKKANLDSEEMAYPEGVRGERKGSPFEYYQEEDLLPSGEKPSKPKAPPLVKIGKRRSHGDPDFRLGQSKDLHSSNQLPKRASSKQNKEGLLANSNTRSGIERLEYLDVDDIAKDTLISRTISQFEMSTDSTGPTSINGRRLQPSRYDSTYNFGFRQPVAGLQSRKLTASRASFASSSHNTFLNRLPEPSQRITLTNPACVPVGYTMATNPSQHDEHDIYSRPTFDKSILFNSRTEKRGFGDVDFGTIKDLKHSYPKRFFNTGMYEFKGVAKDRKDKFNNLKFVMSDVVKSDFVDRSVVSEHFGGKRKGKSRASDAICGVGGRKFKDGDIMSGYGKASTTSVMTNSDLQRMLALNNQIYNKAKQLIKF